MNPFEPSVISTPQPKRLQNFKWHAIAISFGVIVAIEVLFIVTGSLWYPVFHRSIASLPVLIGTIMVIQSFIVLHLCRAFTITSIAILLVIIVLFAMFNVHLMDALSTV